MAPRGELSAWAMIKRVENAKRPRGEWSARAMINRAENAEEEQAPTHRQYRDRVEARSAGASAELTALIEPLQSTLRLARRLAAQETADV